MKDEACKAFQRLRKAGGVAKDDAKYTVHSQHQSLRTCRSVSQLPLGIEYIQGVMFKTFNYMA